MQQARVGEPAKESVSDRLLMRMRADILSFALIPGRILSERDLEAIYGASRTPVRQALLQLAHDGLVMRAGRGYAVASIDAQELLETFEFREIVEAAAVRLACERANEADLDAIQATIDRGLSDTSPETWFEIGADVHVMIASLSANGFLRDAVRDIVTRIARARWLLVSTEAGRREAHREHSEIVALIRAKRADEAEDAIRRHGRNVRDQIMRAVGEGRRQLAAQGMVVKGSLNSR